MSKKLSKDDVLAMGYDITNLYLLCKEQLSDAKKVKYP